MSHFVFVGIGGFLVLVAVFVGALTLFAWLRSRRARASLSLLACPQCQTILGADGARAALKEDRRRKRAMVVEASVEDLEIHVAPEWRFPCRSCGVLLVFDPDANTLIAGPHARP